MSEEKARKDFLGFAEDIQQLRFSLRASLGLSPQRRLERLRSNVQTLTGRFGESMQNRQEQRQQPQQSQRCQGTATPLRGLGILDRFLQLQPQQAKEPLTPEEEEKLKEAREDELRRIEAERKQRAVDRVKSDTHFSVELD